MRHQKGHCKPIFIILLLIAACICALPFKIYAQSNDKVVRVGWFESYFNMTDSLGRKSGYAYEYEHKIASYTGWTYEYVEGSWPDLLVMLEEGKIDLLADVSFTEKRAESMLFSSISMGSEEYYIFIDGNNKDITSDDYSTFSGKKIGVNKGSVQEDIFRQWEIDNNISTEIIEMTCTDKESFKKLSRGEIDMYLTMYQYAETFPDTRPICRIGYSDFYFAMSKERSDLLADLNMAMSRIISENPSYNMELTQKYMHITTANRFLSANEISWLEDHGKIRVGYQDNYLAFCASDKKTGELTGALKDYLEAASKCYKNMDIEFEAAAYPTAAAAIEAMKNGEVDCVFPVNLTAFDSEEQQLLTTPPLMKTDMSAVIRASDLKTFFTKDRISVAVNKGNPNYDKFLLDYFPEWRSIYFEDTPACLKAIADNQADCILISYYRYNNIAELCKKYGLTTVSTGIEMEYYLAVNKDDVTLYSILSKLTYLVPSSTIGASLTYYFTEDSRVDFGDMLKQNMGYVIAISLVGASIIAVLLIRNAISEKRIKDETELISATEIDELTGLYNKGYFMEYAHRMRTDHPDSPMDAVVLNIEQFHTINAINGRSFGDKVLRILGEEIHSILTTNEGIASRAYADKFAIYTHMDDYEALLDRLQNRMDLISSTANIRLRMGVMPYQKDMDVQQQIEHALIACGMTRGHYNKHLIVVDEKILEKEKYEQHIGNDLNRGLENNEFEVYYQPKYDIQSDRPKLISAEALVRWNHPQYGLIAPDEFVPVFERNGRIGEMDRYVWKKAAKQIAVWKKKYGKTIPVSVNLSRIDVFDSALIRTLDETIETNGLDYKDLKLEVTESSCTENPYFVINVIERLKQRGFEIEMDDFGTGYSSLNMLSTMPIDILKMDRTFVSNIEHSKKDSQLVELIISIAKKLNVLVVAEGVETKEQLSKLKKMGCEIVQGYYFSRPVTADEFEKTIIEKSYNQN